MGRSSLALATLAAAVVASAAGAQAPAPPHKTPPSAKLFPYLDTFLNLPPGERSLWTLAYVFKQNGAPPKDMRVWLVEGARRERLPLGPGGRVERLPSAAQLKSAQAEVEASAGSKFSVSMTVAAAVRPGPELKTAELATAVRQADAGVHKAAGLLAMTLPRLDRAVFPGAGGAEAVMADGSRTALPGGAAPYADVALLGKATAIRFTRPPSIILLDDPGKK